MTESVTERNIIMKKGKRKRHALLEKVMSGLMSALMIITTVLTCITPITAKAEGSNYTLISLGEEKWYDDVFSGYDDSMGHWKIMGMSMRLYVLNHIRIHQGRAKHLQQQQSMEQMI